MTIACPDCGTLQDIPRLSRRSAAFCRRCDGDLEKTNGRSITAALACSLGVFLLLFPSNVLPLIQIKLFGMQTENRIVAGIGALWGHDWILISTLSAAFVVLLPFLRFGLLTAVLTALRLGRRPWWLGRAFRWAVWLDIWAMPDVFLLASFVGYYRMTYIGEAHVTIQTGGKCFIAAALLTMLSRATLDRRTVWRAIAADPEIAPGTETVACTSCDLVLPASEEGLHCRRCHARLRARKPDALPRTLALLVAALILFFPANIYPMNVTTHLGTHTSHTIFSGVRALFQSGLWPLGIIIFCTSIFIPAGKILALGWCVLSVWRRSDRHLVAKTKTFRVIAELGRWSKTDPFTVVFFVPLMNFGAFATSDAGWGATAFMVMTFLTMLASSTFDPRLMWDAASAGPK